jgi:hypothetical protein
MVGLAKIRAANSLALLAARGDRVRQKNGLFFRLKINVLDHFRLRIKVGQNVF